jgi:regulator of PEP synthase PpsR (kinase-PPPase family)
MEETEVLRRLEEVREDAEKIRNLANSIYYALKDVQRFLAEKRALQSEPDWCFIDTVVTRMYRDAVEIARDAEEVTRALRRLAK